MGRKEEQAPTTAGGNSQAKVSRDAHRGHTVDVTAMTPPFSGGVTETSSGDGQHNNQKSLWFSPLSYGDHHLLFKTDLRRSDNIIV